MDRKVFFQPLSHMHEQDRMRVQWAYSMAKNWHRGQTRDDGSRYFEHVRNVAFRVIERGYVTQEYIIPALLHDILEDTHIPPSLLREVFGNSIFATILVLSKYVGNEDSIDGSVNRGRKKTNDEYFTELKRLGEVPVVIKCADRCSNLEDLLTKPRPPRWTPEKCLLYTSETREHILPLAHSIKETFFEAKLEAFCLQLEKYSRN